MIWLITLLFSVSSEQNTDINDGICLIVFAGGNQLPKQRA